MRPLFKCPGHPGKIPCNRRARPGVPAVLYHRDPDLQLQSQKVAAKAGFTKALSNKVARHTNAQLWVRFGAECPVLSKMMSHAKVETTKYYYVNIPEIVEGARKIDLDKLGI